MATSVLHRPSINLPSHRHPVKLRPAEKPKKYCDGCKEIIIVQKQCYHCDECEFYLHEECVPPDNPESPFWLGLIHCDLRLQQQKPSGEMVCDACGKGVNGWFYHGQTRINSERKSYNLHPCCAKLDFKRVVNEGGIIFDLQEEETTLVCKRCRSIGCRSWVYISRCQKYCFHVSCMKGSADDCTRVEGSNYGTASSSGGREIQRHGGGQLQGAWDLLIELFIGVTCTIFGKPTWLVAPFVTWIRSIG